MTNKLVVIINSLKVPKIKKILLYEVKFLVRNYSCFQNPWLGGYRPQSPVLCPQLNLLKPPPPEKKFLGTPLVGRGIALLFHDHGTRRGWVIISAPRPHFTSGKDLVPILQEAGWAPVPVWKGGKSHPHQDSIVDCPACSQSLYQLSYPGHKLLRLFSMTAICKQVTKWLQRK